MFVHHQVIADEAIGRAPVSGGGNRHRLFARNWLPLRVRGLAAIAACRAELDRRAKAAGLGPLDVLGL